MKILIAMAMAVGFLCVSVGTASAQAWQSSADDGTGTDLATEHVIIGPPLYYFIAEGTSVTSNTIIVPRGKTITVTLNPNTTGAGSNLITVNLIRRISYETAAGVNNGIVVGGTALTGAGNTAMLWDVPWGEYLIEVVTGTVSGDSYVAVELGIAVKKH